MASRRIPFTRSPLRRRLTVAVMALLVALALLALPALWQLLTAALLAYDLLLRMYEADAQKADTRSGDRIVDREAPMANRRLANLTQYERIGISRGLNLADGHAHQHQDAVQSRIVQRLARLFTAAETANQSEVELEFQRRFFEVAGQYSVTSNSRSLLCYSASQSVDLVAALLAAENMSVGLLQPCFDNLATLLRRRGVALLPVAERAVLGVDPSGPNALFLTQPNNPTGFLLSPEEFERLAARCANTGTVLIVDWTFRFFTDLDRWDQYEILDRCRTSYICIEDTGKTWPTLDLKCSILTASADLQPALAELHNDMLLNVSPFVLKVLAEYLVDAEVRGLDAAVRRVVAVNRRALRAALDGSILTPGSPHSSISVEWLRVASDSLSGMEIVDLLDGAGVAILPGDHFFWHAPDVGARFVRIALARDEATFATAAGRIRALIDRLPQLRAVATS
jgi:aspartate/methionine/tyrosine aminotransferase